MRPASDPVGTGRFVQTLGNPNKVQVHLVLHVCPNQKCIGGVVARYTPNRNQTWTCMSQVPSYASFRASDAIPERPRTILQQANDARATPIACVTTAVRAVEALMAEKGYNKRQIGLKKRIDTAVQDGVLPKLMGDWAHEVREIGNESHTDEDPEPIATLADADRALLFANTLAQYLFVLPHEIARGRDKSADGEATTRVG
jgi:hypothetical protein